MSERVTQISQVIRAPRAAVYRALIDPEALVRWRIPDGMTMRIDAFDGRVGEQYRISLVYEDPSREGKSSERTDTYHGRFVELVPGEKVVEEDEFETEDPALQGPMRITFLLSDTDGGTELAATHEGVPSGVSLADNELGWRMSFNRLRALVELDAYEERLRAAMLTPDVAELHALIAEDLAFVGPDGRVATKAEDLEAHRSGTVRFEKIEYGERHSRFFEGAVFTTVVAELVVWVGEHRFAGAYRYLRVWRIRPEGWQIVGGQVSAVPSLPDARG